MQSLRSSNKVRHIRERIRLSDDLLSRFYSAAPVKGLTHRFYRYPARFSPEFVRQIILQFSRPGDLICDPFMGGGTSIVQAIASGRKAFGVDINSLSEFITMAREEEARLKEHQERCRAAKILALSCEKLAATDGDFLDLRRCSTYITNIRAPRPGLEPGTCALTARRSTN